jgi:hypothetical protein
VSGDPRARARQAAEALVGEFIYRMNLNAGGGWVDWWTGLAETDRRELRDILTHRIALLPDLHRFAFALAAEELRDAANELDAVADGPGAPPASVIVNGLLARAAALAPDGEGSR